MLRITQLADSRSGHIEDISTITENDVGGHERLAKSEVLTDPVVRVDQRVTRSDERVKRLDRFRRAQTRAQVAQVLGEPGGKCRRPGKPWPVRLSWCNVALLGRADGRDAVADADKTPRHVLFGGNNLVRSPVDCKKEEGAGRSRKQKRQHHDLSSSLLHAITE